MKIQYASDLHLEFAENRNFIEDGGIEPVGDGTSSGGARRGA